MELDELYEEVRKNAYVALVAAKKDTPSDKPDPRKLFLDPIYWERKRGIAVVHKETNSIVGNFSEYIHTRIPGVRKLLREEAPISVSATEYVEGSWWLGEGRKPEPKQVWHEARSCIVHLVLEELKVHSPACEVTVHLSYNAIARVELALDTQFAQTEGIDKMLFLPSGTNLGEVMNLEMKMILRKELGL